MRSASITTFIVLLLSSLSTASGDDAPFSGPQIGEALSSFNVQGAFEPHEGKSLDFVAMAKGKPVVLIFVHDVNRQSIAMTRAVATYGVSRAKDGLTTGLVWLSDDVTEAEAELKRIRHALAKDSIVGISLDGKEGPGSYGLNREVMLTILVANENKVTANFALVQPSLSVDLPKVLASVVDQVGGEVPSERELLALTGGGRPGAQSRMDIQNQGPGQRGVREGNAPVQAYALRNLLRPVIRRDASPEQVDEAAKRVEELAKTSPVVQAEIGRITNTIIGAGKLDSYGTPRAQEYLQRWADTYPNPAKQSSNAAGQNAGDKASDETVDGQSN